MGDILYVKIPFYRLKMKEKIIKFFDAMVYWMIIFIPFSIAVSPVFTNIALGFLFFGFLMKKILKKEMFFAKTPIDLPFLILIIVSIISIVNSIDYIASIRGIFKLVRYALIYLVFVEELKDRLHIKRIVLAMLLGASLASFDAIWQIIFGKDFIRGHTPIMNIGLARATAAFPNANVLGVYLSPFAPLVLAFALYYFKAKKRIIMFMVSGLILTGILLTFSRPAVLAVYLSVLFLISVKKDKLLISILVIILILTPFILPKNIKQWAKTTNYNPIILLCNTDRISIYRNSCNMIKHHPIIGVGINTFSKNYLKYKLKLDYAMTGDTIYAHNNFLHMAGEIGLLGLSAFIWLLLRLFLYYNRIYKNLKDNYLKILLLGLAASILAFLINGLTESSLYYARVAMIFWYLIGFSLALGKFADANTQGTY